MNSTGEKILLVDDDDLVLTCFERMLGRLFTLETASGAEQALEAISSRGPFAVLVSDMRMPGTNGLELIRKAKELSPNTVGILLSGNTDVDPDSDVARRGLIYKIVEKPCPYDMLIEILKDALARHRQLERQA